MEKVRFVFGLARRAAAKIAEPLRKDHDSPSFTLSVPEAQTTTVDGGIGWAERPPAKLVCPRCGDHISQPDPRGEIDCGRCVAEFDYTAFPDLELDHLVCPVCGDQMKHGQRHPQKFEIPEWATCNSCRYHWEFSHSFP
jgi:rRNA maturation protein Nop10